MKKVLIFACFFTTTLIIGCPTCIGTITPAGHSFFSDEAYQPQEKQSNSATTKTDQPTQKDAA